MDNKVCNVKMVILNQGVISNKKVYYRRKFKKILKIGILGAFNGIRMRKWFNDEIIRFKKIKPIEEICREHNIPFFTTASINSNYTKELFLEANADLGVSLGNGFIGPDVFRIPRMGMINIHHEILPNYQNAQSIIWQIHNMSPVTGFTIHKIDKVIDGGDIIYQEEVPIVFLNSLRLTIARTSVALLEASARGLAFVLRDFESLQKCSRKQHGGKRYTTPSIWQFLRILKNYKKLRSLYSS
jgi:methionyl-tRNA formyltransferase